ncbi:MAG: cation transporter [Candidatus Latescibacteria bacterium]|nr:cation transporter [Candidatus Latescibacterota bacterium]
MRMKNIVHGLLTALLLGGILSTQGLAQVREVTVKLDGLSCPFCAYGLEKKLKKVTGVEKVEIKVDAGITHLTLKKGKSVSVEEVEEAVKEGGFTPGDVTIAVTGHLTERDGRTVVTIPGSGELFLVEPSEQLRKIEEALKGKDKAVNLTGKLSRERLEGHVGHPYVLSIEHFSIL